MSFISFWCVWFQRNLKKYGVRALPKKRMIETLKKIHEGTHQCECLGRETGAFIEPKICRETDMFLQTQVGVFSTSVPSVTQRGENSRKTTRHVCVA